MQRPGRPRCRQLHDRACRLRVLARAERHDGLGNFLAGGRVRGLHARTRRAELPRPERRRRLDQCRGHRDPSIQIRKPGMRTARSWRQRWRPVDGEPVSRRGEVRQVHARAWCSGHTRPYAWFWPGPGRPGPRARLVLSSESGLRPKCPGCFASSGGMRDRQVGGRSLKQKP